MGHYIDAEKLIAEIERRMEINKIGAHNAFRNGKVEALRETLEYANSIQQEQPEVDYNIIPLPEERMASYIAYCLGREDDDCNCPNCGKHVTGLRLFPYYYDRENNDVYFASVCPECGKIIISKE